MPEPATSPRDHRITTIAVILECSCGEYVSGPTESAALADFEAHCGEEAPDEW